MALRAYLLTRTRPFTLKKIVAAPWVGDVLYQYVKPGWSRKCRCQRLWSYRNKVPSSPTSSDPLRLSQGGTCCNYPLFPIIMRDICGIIDAKPLVFLCLYPILQKQSKNSTGYPLKRKLQSKEWKSNAQARLLSVKKWILSDLFHKWLALRRNENGVIHLDVRNAGDTRWVRWDFRFKSSKGFPF